MKIIKKAIEMGNGAAVYVPKEYANRLIVLLLPEGIDEIQSRILTRLIEFMPNIIGVYLFGSYARGEQEVDSDIDVLVVVKEKQDGIKEALVDFDARIITIDLLKKSIKNTPLLISPILKESKTLLNPELINELKEIKIDYKKFKWNFEDIKRIIKIIEEFVEIDPLDISSSHIYSLILRIKVCYIIECILKDKEFSNKGVKNLLLKCELGKENVDKFYNIYREIRDEDKSSIKTNKDEIIKLIKILKDYSKKIENETKKEIEKRN
jgi:predicted nucleotidyltransferase